MSFTPRRIATLAAMFALALVSAPRLEAAARALTPEEQIWSDRVFAGMAASNLLAEEAMSGGDSYTVGREGGNYTEALALAFRATGDRRFLDRMLQLSDLAKGSLRDAWLDGTTDGYTSWLWLIDPANPTYYGKDTNWLDESISSGNAALWMWTFHANRAIDPAYGAAADYWRGWLENHFLAKWYARAGGALIAWNTPFAAFYKPDTEPRSANWRLAYYLWKVTGNTFYRDRAEEIRAQLQAAVQVNPSVPTAFRWARQLDPTTQEWQAINYANYFARVAIEMNLEGVPFFASPVTMKRFAGTFRDVVYVGTQPARTTMKNDVNGGGSTAYALYAFNGFSAWDSTGFLMDLAEQTITGAGNYASGGRSKAARNDVSIASYALMALSPAGVTAARVVRFDALPQSDGSVQIEFELGSDGGDITANLYRIEQDGVTVTRVNDAPIHGTGRHALQDVPPMGDAVIVYELRELVQGAEQAIGRIEVSRGIGSPAGLQLAQNEPNPFRSATTIRFGLERAARVRLAVIDAGGRLVRELRDGALSPGSYTEVWDGRDARGAAVPSGTYYVTLRTAESTVVRRAVRVQ